MRDHPRVRVVVGLVSSLKEKPPVVPDNQGEYGDGHPLSDRERDEKEPRLTDAPHVAIIAPLGDAAVLALGT
jgi:hypothetical protein